MNGVTVPVRRCHAPSPARRAAEPRFIERLLVRLLALAAVPERMRRRRRLRALAEDPRFLKDVGISRVDALNEASKPGWRP